MCLSLVTQKEGPFKVRKDIGYQVKKKKTYFYKKGVGLVEMAPRYSALFRDERNIEICSGRRTPQLMRNRWYRSSQGTIGRGTDRYPAGFHIYTNKEEAKKMARYGFRRRVVAVKFRNVVAIGQQGYAKVVVAREIKLIKEVE